MALDITQALEFSEHVVGRLLGQTSSRGDFAGSAAVDAGEPEERDHGHGDVLVPGRVDARQHLGLSEVIGQTHPADDARHTLERCRSRQGSYGASTIFGTVHVLHSIGGRDGKHGNRTRSRRRASTGRHQRATVALGDRTPCNAAARRRTHRRRRSGTPRVSGPPPHHHEDADESFYVTSGRLGVMSGDTWTSLGPGEYTNVPEAPCTRSATREPRT